MGAAFSAFSAIFPSSLKRGEQRDTPLKQGDRFVHFNLQNSNGSITSSEEILKSGKSLVVVFYRGGWCPFCNLNLKAIEKQHEKITAAGGLVVAIAPEKIDGLAATNASHKLSFSLCQDAHNAYAKRLGIVYNSAPPYVWFWGFGKVNAVTDAKETTTTVEGHGTLPLPATYIVSRNSEGVDVVVGDNVDAAGFMTRMSPQKILDVLANAQKKDC